MALKLCGVGIGVFILVHTVGNEESTTRKLLISAVITAMAGRVFFLSSMIGPKENAMETKAVRTAAIADFNARREAALKKAAKDREEAVDSAKEK